MKIFFQKACIFFGTLVIFWWFCPKPVFAHILLNEIYANPNTGESEWIELRNSGGETVDLQSWQIWDQLATPSMAFQFTPSTLMEPGEYLIITLNNVLNNTGDEVVLKNAQGIEQDHFQYTSSTKGKSWSRDSYDDWHETVPTPNQPNEIPQLTPPPSGTSLFPQLSEVMACLPGGEEWVELFNPHSVDIPLAGFSLRDNKNQVFSFTQEVLPAGGFFTVELRNVLNNTGDSVLLLSPEKQSADEFTYTACDPTASWARSGEEWLLTSIVTKNAPNNFSQESRSPSLTAPTHASPSAQLTSSTPQSDSFLYPLSVLRPHLAHEPLSLPREENIDFGAPPRLERGALSVIMGSLFLLIPGSLYVKNRTQPF